jgi:hypothetical protein
MRSEHTMIGMFQKQQTKKTSYVAVNREIGKVPLNEFRLELKMGKSIVTNPTRVSE